MPAEANNHSDGAGTVLDVHLIGGFANRMIQYMVVRTIADEVPGCRIANVEMPEWGIYHPKLDEAHDFGAKAPTARNDIDIGEIVKLLSKGEGARFTFKSYAQWFPNFPSVPQCRSMFPCEGRDYPGFGSDCLVCNIRGAEILDGRHGNYVLLPIKFYAELAHRFSLKLVFMGQIEDNPYCNSLKKQFPDAKFCESRGPMADFQTFRNSKNLVMAVSTFSWLSAWLSHAERIIFPMNGILNPKQCPAVDLLPYPDDRYQYYLFPNNSAVPLERLEASHESLQGKWELLPPEMIPKIRASIYRSPDRFFDRFLSMFDEEFYLRSNLDVARVVRAGRIVSGRDHYVSYGFSEGRAGFAFDDSWYRVQYPDAALEVERGTYPDLRHHFVLAGAEQGHKPVRDR